MCWTEGKPCPTGSIDKVLLLMIYRYLAGILTMSEKKRLVIEHEGKLGEPIGRKPAKVFTITGISLLCSLVVTAWVLFIKYSL